MHPESLAALVHKAGVPTVTGRTAAIRQLILEMPAPVVADALGYHHVTTTRLTTEAGGTWSRYAPRRPHTVTSRLDTTENWRQMITQLTSLGRPHSRHGGGARGGAAPSADIYHSFIAMQ
jgi:hypothetical protein